MQSKLVAVPLTVGVQLKLLVLTGIWALVPATIFTKVDAVGQPTRLTAAPVAPVAVSWTLTLPVVTFGTPVTLQVLLTGPLAGVVVAVVVVAAVVVGVPKRVTVEVTVVVLVVPHAARTVLARATVRSVAALRIWAPMLG